MQTLLEVLAESQNRGFLGPGPVQDHIAHAHAFGQALGLPGKPGLPGKQGLAGEAGSSRAEHAAGPRRPVKRILDLGSGGGIPGLVLLNEHQRLHGVLLDGSVTRCTFLTEAVEALHMQDRVEVWVGRAEELGHREEKRFTVDAVVSRSFGPPAQAVECGLSFLLPRGRMVISEPPGGRRWPVDDLLQIGIAYSQSPGVAVLDLIGDPLPDRFPRKINRQRRDPLFRVR